MLAFIFSERSTPEDSLNQAAGFLDKLDLQPFKRRELLDIDPRTELHRRIRISLQQGPDKIRPGLVIPIGPGSAASTATLQIALSS